MIDHLSEFEKLSDEQLQTKLREIFTELVLLRKCIDDCADTIVRLNKIKAAIKFAKYNK